MGGGAGKTFASEALALRGWWPGKLISLRSAPLGQIGPDGAREHRKLFYISLVQGRLKAMVTSLKGRVVFTCQLR